MPEWTYRNLRSDHETTGPLSLRYLIEGTSLSDDHTPAEASPMDLLRLWRKQGYGADYASVQWTVEEPGEQAPFSWPESPDRGGHDFLTWFTWPRDANGERMRWSALPVVDLQWNRERCDKGGSFQELTGWKPSPLVPRLHVPSVLAAAEL